MVWENKSVSRLKRGWPLSIGELRGPLIKSHYLNDSKEDSYLILNLNFQEEQKEEVKKNALKEVSIQSLCEKKNKQEGSMQKIKPASE